MSYRSASISSIKLKMLVTAIDRLEWEIKTRFPNKKDFEESNRFVFSKQ